jgi:peptide/nickel transport system ATP-binding protein
MTAMPVLELRAISKSFAAKHRGLLASLSGRTPARVHAVSDVSLQLAHREVVGLVGESGCGKSTLGRIAAGLIPPSGGEVLLEGRPSAAMARQERTRWARRVQMIFQNPYASLNPRKTVRQTLEEPLRVHGIVPRSQIRTAVDRLLEEVGLDPRLANRRPHQLSGGQCQRVGVARALAVEPDILVCDEPVSALDVSIQAQVLNLFADLRERRTVSYLFISHDLGVVERLSDRVAVMYLGRVVEIGRRQDVFSDPKHPYTKALLEAAPRIGRRRADATAIVGERPSPINPPQGCHFHPRCLHASERCRQLVPPLRLVASDHSAACHLYT